MDCKFIFHISIYHMRWICGKARKYWVQINTQIQLILKVNKQNRYLLLEFTTTVVLETELENPE